MKKMMFGLAVLLGQLVFAQTSVTIKQSKLPQAAGASEINTLSTNVDEVSVKKEKKIKGFFVMNAFSQAKDVKENGSAAMIDSENSLGVFYSANENISLGVEHNFGLRSVGDSQQLADFEGDNGPKSGYKTLDPTVHFDCAMKPLFGSNKYKILSRYYVPVSPASRAAGSNGVLRTQSFITWTLNPQIDLSFYGQARLYLNSNANKDQSRGSDSVLRTIAGPVLGYNFSDVYNVYYNPYLDLKTAGFQRGRFDADVANNFAHEIGAWITLAKGNFIVNPAWVTTATKLNSSSYEGTGSIANTEYDLNLIANF